MSVLVRMALAFYSHLSTVSSEKMEEIDLVAPTSEDDRDPAESLAAKPALWEEDVGEVDAHAEPAEEMIVVKVEHRFCREERKTPLDYFGRTSVVPPGYYGPVHVKARSSPYEGGVRRAHVTDDEVPWSSPALSYCPPEYTAGKVMVGPEWADDPDEMVRAKMGELDHFRRVNRRSFEGKVYLDGIGRPLNPAGRTGLSGRGVLGRFGPNHAGDPIVTRWKTDENGARVRDSDGDLVMEFLGIRRRDTREWALPGGMVDPGRSIAYTVIRELMEESFDSLSMTQEEADALEKNLSEALGTGTVIYLGYVDDPRNTDNAWMETTVFHYHPTGDLFNKLKLSAGDDAESVAWLTYTEGLKLYASHERFVKMAYEQAVKRDQEP
jgi:ADP-ribose pyrophosphatase